MPHPRQRAVLCPPPEEKNKAGKASHSNSLSHSCYQRQVSCRSESSNKSLVVLDLGRER